MNALNFNTICNYATSYRRQKQLGVRVRHTECWCLQNRQSQYDYENDDERTENIANDRTERIVLYAPLRPQSERSSATTAHTHSR